jgi:hypothetical protein
MKTIEMTKKLALVALLLLLSATGMYAQKLDGTWKGGKTFQELIKKAMEEDAGMPNMEISLTFKGNQFIPCIRITHSEEEMSIDMETWVEGTCLRTGDQVNTFVDASKSQLKILSLTSTNEEFSALLNSEATRQVIIAAIEQEVKKKNIGQDMGPVWEAFKSFKVISVTADKLVISTEAIELDFDRVADRKW